MIIAIDAGNTNIKFGIFDAAGALINSWRLAADVKKTADEYGILMLSHMHSFNISLSDIKGVIIASVIPTINYTMEHVCLHYFNKPPIFVGPGIKTGINIKYDNPRDLGADRICNAIAAYKIYGGMCITVDFGTATTFGVINQKGDFLGGAICPGIKTSIDALVENTSRLPKIELAKPPRVIATNTVHALQSGILYGYAGQVDYIIRQIQGELGEEAKVIATGGMSNLIRSQIGTIFEFRPTLTLEGLRMLFELNS